MKKLTPYQRIVRAGERGTGCHLSAEECRCMSIDTAIVELAGNDDEDDEIHGLEAKVERARVARKNRRDSKARLTPGKSMETLAAFGWTMVEETQGEQS